MGSLWPWNRRHKREELLLEELEPRILYSADAAALLPPDAIGPVADVRSMDMYATAVLDTNAVSLAVDAEVPGVVAGVATAAPGPATDAVAATAGSTASVKREIVFVDARVTDAAQLEADIAAQNDAKRQIEVVQIDPNADGIAQIGALLATRHDIDAVHIISHGADGMVELGNTALTTDTLRNQATRIMSWGNAFAAGGDLLLYGCDVAQLSDGRAMVDALARLTGTDVAASTDATGQALLGGNWTLEYASGSIGTAVVVSRAEQQNYAGLLAVTPAAEGFNYTSGASIASKGSVGAGWSGAWSDTPTPGQMTVSSGGLSSPGGQLPVSGNGITLNGIGAFGSTNASRGLSSTVGGTDETVWVSFLVKPDKTSSFDYMGIQLGQSGQQLFVGYQGSNFTMNKSGGGGTTVNVAGAVSGQTALLVLRLDILASGNETATLYVNPSTGLAAPDVTASTAKTDLNVGTFSAIGLAGGRGLAANAAVIDEIRIGSTFLSVAPSVNSAPTITNGATVTLTGTNEDTTSSGTAVSNILTGASWADVDIGAASGIAITTATGNGTWQYSTDGVTWTGFGAVTSTNALLLTSTCQVRYIPDSLNGETATFGFKAWDQTSGSASINGTPGYASTAASGGTTAFSANSASASMSVTAVNDAPVAVADTYSVNEDTTVATTWWNTAWTRRSNITLNGNNFSGATSLTDFPVLITLNSGNIDYSLTQNGGQDLRFFDADGTPLAYEIETWNESGNSYVWVRVPLIDATGADSISMYYGNVTAAAGQNASAVWSSDYSAVYHLNDSGTTIADSTTNAFAGTATNGPVAATGKVGGDWQLDGTNDYLNLGSNRSFIANGSAATLSLWVNAPSVAGSYAVASASVNNGGVANATSRFAIETIGANLHVIIRSDDATTFTADTTTNPLVAGTWKYISATIDVATNTVAIYVDGVLQATTTSGTLPGTAFPNTASASVALGANDDGTAPFLPGQIDEARFANVGRTAAWQRAEYLNMTNAFVAVGAATSAPATGGVLGNDMDADSTRVSALLVAGPANASSFTLNADGTFSYTPVANFNGTDSFQYLARDGATGETNYWGLEGNGTDVIGGANGTLNGGPVTVAGKAGNALQFDGIDDHVLLPDVIYSNEFSLTFQFKVADNSGTDIQYFYSHGPIPSTGTSNQIHVALVEASNATLAQRNNLITTVWDSNDTTGQLLVDIASLINDGLWHTYTLTVSAAAGTQVYVDGTLGGTLSTTGGGPINPTGNAYLGARSDLHPTRYLNAGGAMDSVALYDHALSAAEVAGLAATPQQATATITVNPVNDAPTATIAPLTYGATEQTSLTLHGTGLSIADVDAGSATVQATLGVASGTLNVAAGTTGVTVSNSGTATVTLSGTITQINNLLAGSLGGTVTYIINSDTPPASDTLTLTASDLGNTGTGGTLTANDNATINITAVNDAPTGADRAITTNEDTAYNFTAADFGFTDVDSGDSLSAIRIDSLSVAGSLTLSGAAVTASQVIAAANIGNLVFTPAANANGSGYASFTFSVRDQSGAYDAVPNTIMFNVTAVNDAPSGITTSGALSVQEAVASGGTIGAAYAPGSIQPVVATLSGVDVDTGDTLTYSLVGGATNLFEIFGGNQIRVKAGAIFDFETATSHLVTARVTDSVGATFDQAITINVANYAGSYTGTIGNDGAVGTSEEDSINGGNGNDTLEGGLGADTLDGGAGTDTLSYAGSSAAVAVNLSTNVVSGGDAAGDTISGFENITGSAFGDTLIGDSGSNVIDGGVGDDLLTAGGGNDTIIGGTGTDTVVLSGNWANYAISFNTGTSTYTLTDLRGGSPDGTDTVNGVERFQFADGTRVQADLVNAAPSDLVLTAGSQTNSQSIALAGYTSTPIVIDGVTDAAWASARSYGFSGDAYNGAAMSSPNDTGGGFQVLWDNNALYFRVNVFDDVTQNANPAYWQNDAVELFLDLGHERTSTFDANDIQLIFNSVSGQVQANANPTWGSTLPPGITSAVAFTGTNWVVEGKIQWSGLGFGFSPSQGADIGLAVVAVDSDVAGQESYHGWPGGVGGIDASKMLTARLGADIATPVSVIETAANGTVVATAFAAERQADVATYSLTDSAGGRFAINASTGVVTVADTSLLNNNSGTSQSITIRATDSAGQTYDEAFSINVTKVNDAPTGADRTVTINEDTTYTFSAADFGFSDADGGDTLSAVRVDTLPGTGSLTLSGAAVTASQVIATANIGNLVFTPAPDANGTGYASFTFSVRDQSAAFDAAPKTIAIDVTAVNDAPVRTAGTVASLTVLEDSGFTSLGFGSVAYAPGGGTDETGQTFAYTVTALPSGTVGNVYLADGTTLVTTTTYTLADIRGMQFKPTANASGVTAFQYNVTDSGGTGNGGLNSISEFILLTVTGVNDAPTLTATPLSPGFTEAAGAGTQAAAVAVFGGAAASTVETGQTLTGLTFTVTGLADGVNEVIVVNGTTIALGASSSGTTAFNGLTYNVTISGAAATAVLSGGTLGAAAMQTLVNGITYQNTNTDNPTAGNRVFTLTQITDSGGNSNGGVNATTLAIASTVSVSPTNDAPTVVISAVPLTYTENGAVGVDTSLVVGDVDSGTLAGATVRISANYVAGQDQLSYTSMLGISGAWDGTSGTLTLSGTTSVANYQTALRSIAYYNASDAPSTLSRTLEVVVSDGLATNTPGTRGITIVAVNDAPTLAGANNLATVTEDAVANAGTLVSTLLAGMVSDPDAGAVAGIAVTAVDNTNGAWQYSTDSGGTWTAFGAPSAGSARLLAADAATYVRFVPTLNWNGTVTGGIAFAAWDMTSGAAGGTANIAAGTVLDSFNVVSYAGNNGSGSWTTAWVETDNNAGGAAAGLISVAGGRLTVKSDTPGDNIYREANLAGATLATLSFDYGNSIGAGKGDVVAVQVSSDGGATYTTLTSFTSTANSGTGSNSFDIGAWASATTRIRMAVTSVDVTQGVWFDNVQIAYNSQTGGTSAYSTQLASASITVTPVNDAPTTSAVTLAAIAEDSGVRLITQAQLLGNAADVDGPGLTATSLAIASGGGTLADNGNGTWNYTPVANDDTAVSFTYTVTDGSLTAAGTANLDITPVNDAPTTSVVTLAAIAEDSGIRLITQAQLLGNAADLDGPGLTATAMSIATGAGGLVDNGNGTWNYTPATNDATAVSFTYTVTDGGLTAAGTANLDITPVNDAPAGTSTTLSLPTGVTHIFSAADFGFVDAADSPANALSWVEVATLPTSGQLTNNGVAVTAGQWVDIADINAGHLVFAPVVNGGAGSTASFTFLVRDDGGTANGGVDTAINPAALTLTVPAVGVVIDPVITLVPPPLPPAPPGPVGPPSGVEPTTGAGTGTGDPAPPGGAARSRPGMQNADVGELGGLTRFAPAERAELAPQTELPGTGSFAGTGVSQRHLSVPVSVTVENGIETLKMMFAKFKAADVGSAEQVTESQRGLALQNVAAQVAPVADDAAERGRGTFGTTGSIELTGVVMSAGFVAWALRGGGLLASLAASVPAWRSVDPLPVLAPEEDKPEWDDATDPEADREERALSRLWSARSHGEDFGDIT